MPLRRDDPFSSYTFTEQEIARARELTPEQRCYYQTLMSDAAQEKLAITYNPYKSKEFLQTEAYLRGQIDILNMLLSEGSISRPQSAVVVPPDTASALPDVSLDPPTI